MGVEGLLSPVGETSFSGPKTAIPSLASTLPLPTFNQ